MDDTERVGQRIAATRKSLGLTQQQLADQAKVSKSMLAKVESGHASASNSWVGAIARALGVDVGYLSGQPYTNGSPDGAAVHQLIPSIRRALASWDLIDAPADVPPSSLDDLAAQVNQLHTWRHDTAYQKIGTALPGVLSQLTVATKIAEGDRDIRVLQAPRQGPLFDNELDLETGQQDLVEHPDDQFVLTDGQTPHQRANRPLYAPVALKTCGVRLQPSIDCAQDGPELRRRAGPRVRPLKADTPSVLNR